MISSSISSLISVGNDRSLKSPRILCVRMNCERRAYPRSTGPKRDKLEMEKMLASKFETGLISRVAFAEMQVHLSRRGPSARLRAQRPGGTISLRGRTPKRGLRSRRSCLMRTVMHTSRRYCRLLCIVDV